jgi:hypothetical protein
MRQAFRTFKISLVALAILAGGCDSLQPSAPVAASKPPPAGAKTRSVGTSTSRWECHTVVLEFYIVDEHSGAAIENATVLASYPYHPDSLPIRWVRNEAGIGRLSYQRQYFPGQVAAESLLLRNMWLVVIAPNYQTFRTSLREFVAHQRPVDKPHSIKSPPLFVALRKGERETPPIDFIADRYQETENSFNPILIISGDGMFRIYRQDQHSQRPLGFGFARVVDEKVKLTFAEDNHLTYEGDNYPLEGSEQVQQLVAMVNSRIQEQASSRAKN